MHVFFATDGSASARFAQAQILALPWRAPVQITVMTAVHDIPPAFRYLIPSSGRVFEAAAFGVLPVVRRTPTEVVERARLAFEEKGIGVATRIHEGPPGPTIVEVARACRADLVAVGSRGLGGYKGFLLGSMTDYVVENAHCSVLLAKSPPKAERRFLLAVNDAFHAEAVLRWMQALDLASGAWVHQVVVVRSLDDSFLCPDDARWRTYDRTVSPACPASRGDPPDLPEASGEPDSFPPAVRVTASVHCGQEVPEILATIRDFGPELLVMGAGARRGPGGLMLGDVARKLIHQAPCSVLVVRS